MESADEDIEIHKGDNDNNKRHKGDENKKSKKRAKSDKTWCDGLQDESTPADHLYFELTIMKKEGSLGQPLKIAPSLYEITDNEIANERMLSGLETGGSYSQHLFNDEDVERRNNFLASFDNNPLRYMELNLTYVFGITTREMIDSNKEALDSYPQQSGNVNLENAKNFLNPHSLSTILKSVVKLMNNQFKRKISDSDYTLDSIFPFTRISKPRATSDNYHTKPLTTRQVRVIPIYILPFLLKLKSLYCKTYVKHFDAFIKRLRKICDTCKTTSFYEESFQQLCANYTLVLQRFDIEAPAFATMISSYRSAFTSINREMGKQHRESKTDNKNLYHKIEILEKEVKELKEIVGELKRIGENE